VAAEIVSLSSFKGDDKQCQRTCRLILFFFVLGVDQNDIVLNQNTVKTLFI
jgi:hypothetical protein